MTEVERRYRETMLRWWPEAWFRGTDKGRFAFVQECGDLTVWHYRTLAEAQRQLADGLIGCGGNCEADLDKRYRQHYVVDLEGAREARMYGK